MDLKQLLISFSVLWVSYSVFAQDNYNKGYIITLKQDTVQGLINLRTDKINAACCMFKSDMDASPVIYYPGDIQEYHFVNDGKLYVSRSVELSHGSTVQLFLECLFQGMKNLYYYESEDNKEFYFIESHDRLVKLDAPLIENTQSDGRTFKKEVKRYIPTLHYVFRDCFGIQDKIDRAPFTHKGMVDLVKAYHGMMCNNEEDCIEFVAKADKPKIHVAVTPYIGLQKYTSHDDLKEYGKPVLTYLVGVNAAVSCPRWINSLSLVVDLSVSKLSAKDTRRKSDYSSILLSGKFGGGYTFPRGAVRPFIGAGAVVCGFLSAKYKIGNTRLEPFGGAFPGYYVNLGLLIPVSKKWQHAIMIRAQLEGTRDTFARNSVFTGWSGVLGYSF